MRATLKRLQTERAILDTSYGDLVAELREFPLTEETRLVAQRFLAFLSIELDHLDQVYKLVEKIVEQQPGSAG